jgi:hypothetical protein
MEQPLTSKQKGDLLERIVGQLCAGIENANTETNAKIVGRSGVSRQIDILIKGTVGPFEVMMLIDSKNYSVPVDIKDIETIIGMVDDVGANLGAVVCPAGFTDGAKKRAQSAGIHLYEIFDQALGNTDLFLPVRYVSPRVGKYRFQFSGTSAAGHFRLPADSSRWLFHIDGVVVKPTDVPVYLWNRQLFLQEKGEHVVTIGAVKITDPTDAQYVQYCDLEVHIQVVEDYYLKLFPASFIKRVDEVGKEHFGLRFDAYSKKQDMLNNGWTHFETLEEMNKAAHIENQPATVRDLLLREEYTLDE